MAYGIRENRTPGFSYQGYQNNTPAYRAPQRKFRQPTYQETKQPSPIPGMALGLAGIELGAAEKFIGRGAGVKGASAASGGVGTLGLASSGVAGTSAGMLARDIATEFGGNEELSYGAGLVTAAGTGAFIGGPVGAGVASVGYAVAESTWLCTATKESVGLKSVHVEALNKLRDYARRTHKKEFMFYLRQGKKLVKEIKNSESNLKSYYDDFRRKVVDPVAKLIFAKEPEAAFKLYAAKTRELFGRYMSKLEIKYV